jgi:hypothetical protein
MIIRQDWMFEVRYSFASGAVGICESSGQLSFP